MNKKYHIITIGCQMNKSDSERIAGYLESLGFKQSRNKYEADLVVVNTCGVRQSAEDRVYGLIPRIKKENTGVKIILTGCLSERLDVQKRLKGLLDACLPIKQISNIKSQIVKKQPALGGKLQKNYLKIRPKYESMLSAFVPIGNGCNNFCSYCVVPYARGREIYRPVQDILGEIQGLVEKGYKEIILIAQNVNSYKAVIGKKGKYFASALKNKNVVDFADLLKMVNNIEGDFWIRFATSHPKDMSDKLIKTISACNKVCEHVHLPAQAGDNKILRAMNRGYTDKHYKGLVKKIKKIIPDIAITTDIIVGFPGETREKFNQTVKLFREVKFDMAYIARYSPRPGTSAENLDDNISKAEKKKREEVLMKILRKTALENNKKYLDKTVDVLIEGKNKKGEWHGKTRSGKSVKCLNSANKDLSGCFVKVKINEIQDFGLLGKIIDGKNNKIVVVLGPTASGKTSLAVKLAKKFNGEIISADSRQVYRGMDIGTGKDLSEYGFGNEKIPYHLIDVASPKTKFNLAKYQKLAFEAIDDVLRRGKLPIVVGGSGLYLQAVVDNYNLTGVKPNEKLRLRLEKMSVQKIFRKISELHPRLAAKVSDSDKKNKRRLIRYLEILKDNENIAGVKDEKKYDALIMGLTHPREILNKRILKRLIERLEKEKMVEEVKNLHDKGVSWKKLEDFGLEYRFISHYLQDKLDYDEMMEKLNIAIRQFAKRQMTWFRRWERQGNRICWIKHMESAERKIKNFLK